jgi:hypothetical protein
MHVVSRWQSEPTLLCAQLLALHLRDGQSHPNQRPDGVGTAGLPAAPFINVLVPLQALCGFRVSGVVVHRTCREEAAALRDTGQLLHTELSGASIS